MSVGVSMVGGNPVNKRRDRDFYPTPAEVTLALLKAQQIAHRFEGPIFEPACGDGALAKVFEAAGYKVIASDIHPLGYGVKRDFLTVRTSLRGVNVVTNPPFNLARQFIEHALSLEPRSMALLLKGTYWHAKTRLPLFERYRPAFVHPLTWRPDFLEQDHPTMEVAWCVWVRGNNEYPRYIPLEKPEIIYSDPLDTRYKE